MIRKISTLLILILTFIWIYYRYTSNRTYQRRRREQLLQQGGNTLTTGTTQQQNNGAVNAANTTSSFIQRITSNTSVSVKNKNLTPKDKYLLYNNTNTNITKIDKPNIVLINISCIDEINMNTLTVKKQHTHTHLPISSAVDSGNTNQHNNNDGNMNIDNKNNDINIIHDENDTDMKMNENEDTMKINEKITDTSNLHYIRELSKNPNNLIYLLAHITSHMNHNDDKNEKIITTHATTAASNVTSSSSTASTASSTSIPISNPASQFSTIIPSLSIHHQQLQNNLLNTLKSLKLIDNSDSDSDIDSDISSTYRRYGIARHRILLCSTSRGKIAIARHLEPMLYVDRTEDIQIQKQSHTFISSSSSSSSTATATAPLSSTSSHSHSSSPSQLSELSNEDVCKQIAPYLNDILLLTPTLSSSHVSSSSDTTQQTSKINRISGMGGKGTVMLGSSLHTYFSSE